MARLFDKLARRTTADPGSVAAPIGRDDSARRLALLDSFERSGLGWLWASDAQGRLVYLSQDAFERTAELDEGLLGQPLSDIWLDEGVEAEESSQRPLKFLLAARHSFDRLEVCVHGSKQEYWWEISGRPQFDSDGHFAGFHGSARDITAQRATHRDARKMARRDALTGLANRHQISASLKAKLDAFRTAKRSCALMMLDLDRFKQVNDTLGHPAGDELLKQVADRLRTIVGDKGEIGRLGGDEFQIILPDIDDRGDLGALGARIIQLVSQPYSIGGSRAIIGTSVGIAIAPYDGVDVDELVKSADLALYAAKGSGRGKYRFYTTELKDNAATRRRIEEDLRDALDNGEIALHYQPIVDAKRHRLVCLESLFRWFHPTRGAISPADFVPIAEDSGLITSLGRWALHEACNHAAKWPEELRVAINVSVIQFSDENFVDQVASAIKQSGIDPARVELEITESVFAADIERTERIFKQLKKLGVRIALDDFGTGYSSLSYLRNAPFSKIKIDQSFVRGATENDNNNSALISAIVGLASALGMETVAEGVETQDELALVARLGASHVQGWIFSEAISNEQLVERLERGDLIYEPKGPARYRAERRHELRQISLIHDDHRYRVRLRNLSRTGALIEGLLDVPVGTEVVLDFGGGQLAVATVRRSNEARQGVEFETALIDDGNGGLCTRHRVSPYLIEAAGKPLRALGEDPYGQIMAAAPKRPPQFLQAWPEQDTR